MNLLMIYSGSSNEVRENLNATHLSLLRGNSIHYTTVLVSWREYTSEKERTSLISLVSLAKIKGIKKIIFSGNLLI